MTILAIISVLTFGTILSYIEMPKMIKSKSYKEFWTFSVLLLLGVVLAILKSLDVPLSNPSDWVAWSFSPISDLIKPIFE